MSTSTTSLLPAQFSGEVISGFGRGSKELGCPTANLPVEPFPFLENMDNGVYFGWAQVAGGEVSKAVASIGWNPHYDNTVKTFEVHILREFADDFYGSELRVVLCGYIRAMTKFNSLDELKAAIASDIEIGSAKLDEDEFAALRTHELFGGGGVGNADAAEAPAGDAPAE